MLSVFLIPMELGSVVMFLTGALMLIIGMGFFQLGAEMAMTPIGEGVGVQISKMQKLLTVLLTGFLMGVIITISEPDLQVLAWQVPSVPNKVLILTVALGVVFSGAGHCAYPLYNQPVHAADRLLSRAHFGVHVYTQGVFGRSL